MAKTDENVKKKTKKAKVRIFERKKKGNNEKSIIENLQSRYEQIDTSAIKSFAEFPLSAKTLRGLKENKYIAPTDIQKESIGLSLQGKDVLGAAKTGSGKTLAFLIPLLEILYTKQWTNLDGLGALVITPTRELAYQIFETLRKIGVHHDFSAGLIIGGKDLKFERKRMDQCNIVIGTPGRLLQHMDENPLFDCVNMQVLVLDEADRCLDMGFQQTMNAIIANLPPKRQTLLFSATQTKSVKDLARLSLKDPSYISVHENSKHSTPEGLQQNYVVCELNEKFSILWSFIRNHLKQKCIIFLSSCKQVKYIYEIFCRLKPGVSLMALYGTLHQLRRMAIYESFCTKHHAVLFATDLAARGLDFPEVHWVVQADCPEDADTYIHRVGRTARYHRGGESLLLLMPSEEKAMLAELEQKKIPIEKIDINTKRMANPIRKMEACLARDPNLKDTAQRAFVAYAKSVFLMKNKKIFNIKSLDTDAYAHSLGLAIPPRIRFLQRLNKQAAAKKTVEKLEIKSESDSANEDADNLEDVNGKVEDLDIKSEAESSNDDEPRKLKTKKSKTKDTEAKDDAGYFEVKNKKSPFFVSDDSEEDDDGILQVKRKDHDIEDPLSESEIVDFSSKKTKKVVTKAALAKKILKKKIVPNKKTIFNDEGEALVSDTKEKRSELAQQYEHANEGGINIEEAKQVLRAEDKFDKQRFREKIKAKHKEEKRKLKEQKRKLQEERVAYESDSGDEGPDLSWLPDPDKLYGKIDEDNNADDVEEKPAPKVPKRKMEPKHSPAKKKKPNVEKLSAALSVDQAEELALMLLKNKQ